MSNTAKKNSTEDRRIVTNRRGDVLVAVHCVDEPAMTAGHRYQPLTHALVVVRYDGRFLLIYNGRKGQWELPGGIIDPGETPRKCAMRELREETNQVAVALAFRGVMELKLTPDRRTEYGALYAASLTDLQPFRENEEASQIVLWDGREKLENIDAIDRALLAWG